MVKSNKMKLSFTNLDRIYVVFIIIIFIYYYFYLFIYLLLLLLLLFSNLFSVDLTLTFLKQCKDNSCEPQI